MGLRRSERVAYLRGFHGATWVESSSEMRRRMVPALRARLDRLRFGPSVTGALARRRLMRRLRGMA